jgi:hypothetical protein
LTKELRTLSWAEAAILILGGLFRDNERLSRAANSRRFMSRQGLNWKFIVDIYIQISTQVVDDILYQNIKAKIAVIQSKLYKHEYNVNINSAVAVRVV